MHYMLKLIRGLICARLLDWDQFVSQTCYLNHYKPEKDVVILHERKDFAKIFISNMV